MNDEIKNQLVFLNLTDSIRKIVLDLDADFKISDEPAKLINQLNDFLYNQGSRIENEEKEIFNLKKQLYDKIKNFEQKIIARKSLISLSSSQKSNEQPTSSKEEELKIENQISELKKLIEEKSVLAKRGEEELEELELEYENTRAILNNKNNGLNMSNEMEKKLEAELNAKSQSNNILASRIQLFIQINTKLNNENPLLQTYCRQLEDEYESLYMENEKLLQEIAKVDKLRQQFESVLTQKSEELSLLSLRKEESEVGHVEELSISSQIRLEEEIRATLKLENEVLMKQAEVLMSPSTSYNNSLAFLMNESFIRAEGEQEELKRELDEKKKLMESLKIQNVLQMKNDERLRFNEKVAICRQISRKIEELEELVTKNKKLLC